MSDENEFAVYSLEELESKKKRFKRIQVGMILMAAIVSAVLTIVTLVKDASNGLQIVPIILVVGIAYPLLAFGPMRKKIQEEIDSRKSVKVDQPET